MPVKPATDGKVEPNNVYVALPNSVLTIKDYRLQLLPLEGEARGKPIDRFFTALAEDLGEAAVGVLLSGSGSDGALGMKTIKERGGHTIAQGRAGGEPAYNDMPDAAIAIGAVDLEVPIEEIPRRLAYFADNFSPTDAAEPGGGLRRGDGGRWRARVPGHLPVAA